jgi:hydrogenase-4 component E
MNHSAIDIFAAGIAVLGVWMCGVTRVEMQLWGLVLQATLLSFICARIGISENSAHLLILASVMLLIKAILIPLLLDNSLKQMKITHDKGANISPTLTLVIGSGLLVAGYLLIPQIGVSAMLNPVSSGMAASLIFIGMLLMITRRLAISQVIGFLTMENGISLYSLTQTRGMPLLLEMAIVFEVLIGVLIAGLVIFHINRSFEHIDVTHMRGLRH